MMEMNQSKKNTIMLVDDHEDIRQVFAIGMERFGFSVETAKCGKSALALLDQIQPDIVILDYGLPDLDGIELGQQVQAQTGNQTTLILFSGNQDADVMLRAKAAGFAACLTKPVPMPVLRDQLERLKSK